MNILLIYFVLFLGHLCVYFYFKHNVKYSKFSRSNTNSGALKDIKVNISQLALQVYPNQPSIKENLVENKYILLNKSLKHLEFITEFEMYLEQKSQKNFSIDFLQEFEQIKIDAQLTALKTTNHLNTNVKIAA